MAAADFLSPPAVPPPALDPAAVLRRNLERHGLEPREDLRKRHPAAAAFFDEHEQKHGPLRLEFYRAHWQAIRMPSDALRDHEYRLRTLERYLGLR